MTATAIYNLPLCDFALDNEDRLIEADIHFASDGHHNLIGFVHVVARFRVIPSSIYDHPTVWLGDLCLSKSDFWIISEKDDGSFDIRPKRSSSL